LWVLVTLPGLGHQYAYEWDSAQMAMGVADWDIKKHQPHPMGFPLWILLLKALQPALDPMLAQRVLSLLFTIAGLAVLRLLVKDAMGEMAALVVTALIAWSPPVRMLAVAQSTYPVDFLCGGVAGWLAMKAWRGDARSAFLLPVAVALVGGVRSSTASFLAPLVGVTLLVFVWRTRSWVAPAGGVAIGMEVTAAWVAAVVQNVGGVDVLQQVSDGTFGEALRMTSMFHGAPWSATVKMMRLSTLWIGLGLIGLLAPICVWALVGRMWRPVEGEALRPIPGPLNNPVFYFLWVGPMLGAIYLIHGPKPGYQMLALPAMALAAAIVVWRVARRFVLRERMWAAATLALGLFAALTLTWLPYDHLFARGEFWFDLFRAMPQVHDDVDESTAALFRLVDERGSAAILLHYRATIEGPNSRTLEYYRPQMPQSSARRKGSELLEGYAVTLQGEILQMEMLPAWVKEVLVVVDGSSPELSLRTKFPLMRRIHKGRFIEVWAAPYR